MPANPSPASRRAARAALWATCVAACDQARATCVAARAKHWATYEAAYGQHLATYDAALKALDAQEVTR